MLPLKDDIPSQHFPYVTISLIVINILVFFFHMSLGRHSQNFSTAYGTIPFEIIHLKDIPPSVPFPVFFTLFTSMFLHAGFWHVGGNMLYLWVFGDNVEDAMGSFRFLIFYLLCGIIASLSHIFSKPNSLIPMVGASGAISGVLGAYLLLYPRAKVLTLIIFFYFIRIIKLPSLFLLGFWIVFQLIRGTLSLSNTSAHGGVAWFAHIGGFFAGMILISAFKKKRIHLGAFRLKNE